MTTDAGGAGAVSNQKGDTVKLKILALIQWALGVVGLLASLTWIEAWGFVCGATGIAVAMVAAVLVVGPSATIVLVFAVPAAAIFLLTVLLAKGFVRSVKR